MSEISNDLVFHDGFYFKEEQLLKMAMTAGSWSAAEHYMFSLLAHAVLYHKIYILDSINEVREYYRIIPIPKNGMAESHKMPHDKWQPSLDDQARKVYKKMSRDEKRGVLRTALLLLRLKKKCLFSKNNGWIGIYLVIKDRLDGNLKPKDFYYQLAMNSMPADWPDYLRINKSTLSTMSRYIKAEDRELAYYEMEDNPFDELCNEFWNLLSEQILTSI